MLRIPHTIMEQMIDHAKREYPHECCGLLAGHGIEVFRIYETTNRDRSRTSYFMEPKEQFKIFKDIRKKGLELKAIYHSHPDHPAYPSRKDVELAYYPDAVYIIISIDSDRNTVVKGFNIVDSKVSETEIEIG